MLYPLLFEPVYKDFIWGGERVAAVYDRPVPRGRCAESWELSDNPEGLSVVANGPYAGKTLRALLVDHGRDILGDAGVGGQFPLLIKILDARETVSIQVHPNERTAPLCGGEPKTEMWYVLSAEPGAKVYIGFKDGVDAASLQSALSNGTVESLLNAVDVSPGTTVFVPGGRVHAIGAGCLILEVQQTSSTTYRLYDWGRLGADGKPRELHVGKAMQCIVWQDTQPRVVEPRLLTKGEGYEIAAMLRSPFFSIRRMDLSVPRQIVNEGESFHILFVETGSVRVVGGCGTETLVRGRTCLMPASIRDYTIEPIEAPARIICTVAAQQAG
jgi:mannose-6-phosphate isomerase